MTTKRKAPPAKADQGQEPPTLDSLAEHLRALNVDPVWVLFAALEGEKVAKGKTPIDALRTDPRTLYSPTVLDALAQAAIQCRMPGFGGKAAPMEELEGLFLTEVHVDPMKGPRALLFEAYKALVLTELPAVKGAKRLLHATEALRFAREIEKLVEVEGRTRKAAASRVAAAHGMETDALLKRIQRARSAFPGDDWPKKSAGRL